MKNQSQFCGFYGQNSGKASVSNISFTKVQPKLGFIGGFSISIFFPL